MVVDHINADGSRTKHMIMNNKYTIPMVGYGTFLLNGGQNVRNSIISAVKAGYRLIDTATLYRNERSIGTALKSLITSGEIKREDIFLTTKIWNTNHEPERTMQSIRNSLRKLQTNYLDLVLIHFPTGFRVGKQLMPKYANNASLIPRTWRQDAYMDTWRALEHAVWMGSIRSIGVSNFNIRQMETLLANATIMPVMNQVSTLLDPIDSVPIRFECKEIDVRVLWAWQDHYIFNALSTTQKYLVKIRTRFSTDRTNRIFSVFSAFKKSSNKLMARPGHSIFSVENRVQG